MKIFLGALIGLLLSLTDRNPYRKIIKKWSRPFNMKVKYYNRYTDHFSIDIIDNIIYISRFNKAVHDPVIYLYSIAHEFGHLIDYAYREYYYEDQHIHTDVQDNKAIYRDEVVAWKVSKILIKEAGVYDKDKFNKLRDNCLEQYRVALKLPKIRKTKSKKKPK